MIGSALFGIHLTEITWTNNMQNGALMGTRRSDPSPEATQDHACTGSQAGEIGQIVKSA